MQVWDFDGSGLLPQDRVAHLRVPHCDFQLYPINVSGGQFLALCFC